MPATYGPANYLSQAGLQDFIMARGAVDRARSIRDNHRAKVIPAKFPQTGNPPSKLILSVGTTIHPDGFYSKRIQISVSVLFL